MTHLHPCRSRDGMYIGHSIAECKRVDVNGSGRSQSTFNEKARNLAYRSEDCVAMYSFNGSHETP